MSYYCDGREYRETTGTIEEKQARKALRLRLQEVANDKSGIQPFLGPSANRLRINDLLDELEQDYRVRGKLSPSITSHLKRVRERFGNTRATQLDAKEIDSYIAEQLEANVAPATINRGTQLLSQSYSSPSCAIDSRKSRTSESFPRKISARDSSNTISSPRSSSACPNTCGTTAASHTSPAGAAANALASRGKISTSAHGSSICAPSAARTATRARWPSKANSGRSSSDAGTSAS